MGGGGGLNCMSTKGHGSNELTLYDECVIMVNEALGDNKAIDLYP